MQAIIRKLTILTASFFASFVFVMASSANGTTSLFAQSPVPDDTVQLDENGNPVEDTSTNTPTQPSPEDLTNPFTDIHEGNYHYIPILELTAENIISGYDDGTFHAYKTINRAETLKLILEAFGNLSKEEYREPSEKPFEDTELGEWYTKYVVIAKNRGIIDGRENNLFKPFESVNLAEALKILEKTLKNYLPTSPQEDPFADVQTTSWYADYFQYAKDREMLNINSDNTVNPYQEMTRGYLAEVIYKLKYFGEDYHFGKATYYGAAVQGHGTASGETFDMNAMTAAHKTLPFGTIVEVTNIANGKTVQVRITYRGPYGPGRVLDLTSGAFKKIADLHEGVINIQYRVKATK